MNMNKTTKSLQVAKMKDIVFKNTELSEQDEQSLQKEYDKIQSWKDYLDFPGIGK